MIPLNIFMRALHILCAVTLLGGVACWRFGAIRGVNSLPPEQRVAADDAIAAAWRPFVICSALGLLISGGYNIMAKQGMPAEYQMIFGIKFLLALHVFAVAILAGRENNPKRARQLTGVAGSGFLIVILSAVLRYYSTR